MAWTKAKTRIVVGLGVLFVPVIAIVTTKGIRAHKISATIQSGGILPVSGIVVDAHGQPIAGAIVCIPPGASDEAKTDARGRFEFNLQTKWAMQAEADKKSAASQGRFTQSRIFVRDTAHNLAGIVELGKVAQQKAITMTPAMTISGRVVDARGTGIKGAKVDFSLSPIGASWDAYFPESVVLTDDQGRYEISAMPVLPGGYYSIHVRWKPGNKGVDWVGQINMADDTTGKIEVQDRHGGSSPWPVRKDESGRVEVNDIVVKDNLGQALFQ